MSVPYFVYYNLAFDYNHKQLYKVLFLLDLNVLINSLKSSVSKLGPFLRLLYLIGVKFSYPVFFGLSNLQQILSVVFIPPALSEIGQLLFVNLPSSKLGQLDVVFHMVIFMKRA